MKILLYLLLYAAIGVVAGLMAGLFGVGGGVIIVPALVLGYSFQGIDPGVIYHLAVGTSFMAIVITATSSIGAHHQRGAVRWPLFWTLVPGLVLGVLAGSLLAGEISGTTLKVAFGVFVILVSIKMGFNLQPAGGGHLPGRLGQTVAGSIIGAVSAFFGIGGGSLTVPYLNHCRVAMQEAVGTSAACGLPIAIAGALGFLYTGWGNPALPEWSSGYIYWPAFIGIVATSFLFARLGARLAHHLAADRLRRVFALFLFIMGVLFIYRTVSG